MITALISKKRIGIRYIKDLSMQGVFLFEKLVSTVLEYAYREMTGLGAAKNQLRGFNNLVMVS